MEQSTHLTDTPTQVPAHIGIIMDGNGRWAEQRHLDRTKGHFQGIEPAKESVQIAIQCGVSCVSLYIFSTENWKRPRPEINFILSLVAGKLHQHYDFYRTHNIKVVHSGNPNKLGPAVLNELSHIIEETQNNTAITVNLAFNYGGRDEIIQAIQRYNQNPKKATLLTEKIFAQYLYHPELPPLDLMIRTGGQKRISNFLLWQVAYSELYFSDVLWPDWNKQCMKDAILFYQQQQRRFGGINA